MLPAPLPAESVGTLVFVHVHVLCVNHVAGFAGAAWRAGLTAIVCVGETKDERVSGKTLDVVGGQIAGSLPDGCTAANTVVAYEPVWAIGTGKVATTEQVAEIHHKIDSKMKSLVSSPRRRTRSGSGCAS